jgi:hypothetical protein
MAASKSRPPSVAPHPAGSANASICNGTIYTSACSRRRPASCCASTSGPARLASAARRGPTVTNASEHDRAAGPREHRRSAPQCGLRIHPPARGACWCPSDTRRARPRQETCPGPRRRRRESRARTRRADLSLPPSVPRMPAAGAADAPPSRPTHSSAHAVSRSHRSQNRRPTMNLIELDRALRQLRLSGMAAVLETRLRHAQTEKVTPIDLDRSQAPAPRPVVVCQHRIWDTKQVEGLWQRKAGMLMNERRGVGLKADPCDVPRPTATPTVFSRYWTSGLRFRHYIRQSRTIEKSRYCFHLLPDCRRLSCSTFSRPASSSRMWWG